ncbi:amidohydrolase family protein [Paraburkholderia nemoris]|jgi:6-methylsalicylate decarboxylase|uniref:amidohydrolase family protein n=1 Tax=Paraburkholderia nemoris TaxID=2793076 RepID=UPI0038BC6482
MPKRKIDTHQHFLPKLYVDAVGLDLLNAAMPGGVAPTWSVEAALAMMDENGIDEGILSISSGPTLPDAATLLRKCNDLAAELRARHPGRFGSFASLPLPDVDAALKEVSYCLDVLKVDGFIAFTNYNGLYLGDELFTPLWEELNRRGTVVFIHPNQPPHEIPPVAPASVLEYPFETTRTATSLIMSGAMSRFRNIRFILSHAGGTLPFLVPRIALSISMMPAVAERVGDTLAAVRSFYFDTALSAGNAPLSALTQVADPDHILFGTDFPFAPTSAIRQFGKVLDNIQIPGIELDKVYGDNAARLLGR